MRRSVADYIDKKKKEYEAHILYDKEFLIKPTSFVTNNKEQSYENMSYIKDISEDGVPVYKKKTITGIGFARKPYIVSSNNLFDIVRSLPKQAYILFKYIIDNLDYNKNYIILTTEDIKNILNTKYQPVASKAINDLIDAKLICKCVDKTEKNTYCINHQEYFKGNFTNFIINHNKIYGVVNEQYNNREDVND